MKKIISIVAMIAVVGIFLTYFYGILSENNEQIDVEGTVYESGYNSNTKIQVATGHLIAPLGLLFGVLCLVLALKKLKKQVS